MSISRRSFVAGTAAAAVLRPEALAGQRPRPSAAPAAFDPWLEIEAAALVENVGVVSRLSGGRPIMAVVKNNAYGLGLSQVASVLEPLTEIMGFAVVKTEAALALRSAGVRKPVLLMGLFGEEVGPELVRQDIHLCLATPDAPERIAAAVAAVGGTARVHAYIDTGMSRMGLPYHQAATVMARAAQQGIALESTFTALTEESDFDPEQIRRLQEVAAEAARMGAAPGALHAASSNGVFHLPQGHMDLVRPGIALYGAYPSDFPAEQAIAELRPAVRLKARVVRVEQLRPGDTVSYGRNYEARRPTWIATLPAGHTDGVPRTSVNGARVLINDVLYPVIGAVSASHSIVELGSEKAASVGDVATFLGGDRPALHPNAVAQETGTSVYDVLMHLNPGLPKVMV